MCVPVEMQFMSAPKSVTCTHLHAHFQSTFSTRVHKNLCTHYCEHTWARMHTNFSLTRVIIPTSPDFLLKLMKNSIQSSLTHFGQIWSILDRFDPFWTDLIHIGQIWSILDRVDPIWWKKDVSFLSSCNLYTQHYLFYWTPDQFKVDLHLTPNSIC